MYFYLKQEAELSLISCSFKLNFSFVLNFKVLLNNIPGCFKLLHAILVQDLKTYINL